MLLLLLLGGQDQFLWGEPGDIVLDYGIGRSSYYWVGWSGGCCEAGVGGGGGGGCSAAVAGLKKPGITIAQGHK